MSIWRCMAVGLLIGLFVNGISVRADAQSNPVRFRLNIVGQDTLPKSIQNLGKRPFEEAEAKRMLEELEQRMLKHGFLTYHIGDTVRVEGESIITVFSGRSHKWARLELPDLTKEWMNEAGANTKQFDKGRLDLGAYVDATQKAIRFLENNGFPFARMSLDSVEVKDGLWQGKLSLDRGPLIVYDSINLLGDANISLAYMSNLLNLKPGKLYSERDVRAVGRRISEVEFLELSAQPVVYFVDERAQVNCFVDTKKASRFNGIIGFLPDNQTGEITLTGDVKLSLQNSLGRGERLQVNWRKLQTNTQELKAYAMVPFILGTSFGSEGSLVIYRRDTLFTDITRRVGARYQLPRSNALSLFFERQTTNLLSTTAYESLSGTAPFLDRAINWYGVALNYDKLDYRLNPSNGVEIETEMSAGTKSIIENANLPETLYENLELSSLQLRISARAGYYVKLLPKLVWHQKVNAFSLINDQLFNNEAARIGGLLTLRGFDEESIFATSFAIGTSELRYLFETNSYLHVFSDLAWYENMSMNHLGARTDLPIGFGAGFTLQTKPGLFSMSYALGSQQGNPIQVRSAKIHFGFLSLF